MKKYISVTAEFDEDGNLIPLTINWSDGRKFTIDRITDIRYSSVPCGRGGLRYTCRIAGKDKFIFFEDNRWFVEKSDKEISA